MSKGLKCFSRFDRVFLDVRAGKDRIKDFVRTYGVKTGENVRNNKTLILRNDKSAWAGSLDCKVHFDAPAWVVDSLRVLGINVLVDAWPKFLQGQNIEVQPCKYSVSSNELFWWLVDFGYRLGENSTIPVETNFDIETRKTLKPIEINQKVAEIV